MKIRNYIQIRDEEGLKIIPENEYNENETNCYPNTPAFNRYTKLVDLVYDKAKHFPNGEGWVDWIESDEYKKSNRLAKEMDIISRDDKREEDYILGKIDLEKRINRLCDLWEEMLELGISTTYISNIDPPDL